MKIIKVKNIETKVITELTIRSKSHWNYSNKQVETWRNELTVTEDFIEQNHVYKLINRNRLIGFYAYQPLNKITLELSFLFIEPEYIGQGFGKKLMIDFLKKVKNTEFKKVKVESDPNAEKFYSRFGFKVIGQMESSIKDRFLPIMEKEINQVHINVKT